MKKNGTRSEALEVKANNQQKENPPFTLPKKLMDQ